MLQPMKIVTYNNIIYIGTTTWISLKFNIKN